MKYSGIQYYVSRVAALSRAKVPKADELAEARQDLQEARLRRDIGHAMRPKKPYVVMDAERRRRLAEMLYPEGSSK